jgi:hypothetical protein
LRWSAFDPPERVKWDWDGAWSFLGPKRPWRAKPRHRSSRQRARTFRGYVRPRLRLRRREEARTRGRAHATPGLNERRLSDGQLTSWALGCR